MLLICVREHENKDRICNQIDYLGFKHLIYSIKFQSINSKSKFKMLTYFSRYLYEFSREKENNFVNLNQAFLTYFLNFY